MNFDVVKSLADTFNTSLTATAIRLVGYGPLPTMLICYSATGREWFVRGPDVPQQLWPSEKPSAGTYALELLKGATERELKGESPAGAWFDRDIAERYYVHEHSLRTNYGVVLTLLWWKNERMLIAIEE